MRTDKLSTTQGSGDGEMPTSSSGTITTGTGNVQAITRAGEDTAVIRLRGTYAGLVAVTEVSMDGSSWTLAAHTRFDVAGVTATTVSPASNASVSLVISVRDVNFVRVRATALTSGTVNVTIGVTEDPWLASGSDVNLEPAQVDTSSARTVSGNGNAFTNIGGAAVAVFVNVTAVSGTTPAATFRLQQTFDGTTFVDVDTTNLQTVSVTATGLHRLEWGPGVPTTANVSKQGHPLRTMRLAWTITGTTPSFTFASFYHSVG